MSYYYFLLWSLKYRYLRTENDNIDTDKQKFDIFIIMSKLLYSSLFVVVNVLFIVFQIMKKKN